MTKYNKEYMLGFAKELAQLLERYNVSIEACGDDSDTHGVFHEEMLISPPWQEGRSAHTISIRGGSIDVHKLNRLF